MAEQNPFEAFRLTLMQDVLPVGLAMADRVRQGGAAKVVESFTGSADPFSDLRDEGQASARVVRERLDQVSPGLGNPVIEVTVDVDPEPAQSPQVPTTSDDGESLHQVLARIESRLDQLQQSLAS